MLYGDSIITNGGRIMDECVGMCFGDGSPVNVSNIISTSPPHNITHYNTNLAISDTALILIHHTLNALGGTYTYEGPPSEDRRWRYLTLSELQIGFGL